MTNPAPLRLPETMQRADIGPYLAELREHFHLSLQDVAAQLNIRVRYIQAMETNAYELLPGPVYARGYLFTYAEFMGLDAAQVVEICFAAEQKPATVPPPLSATAKQFDAMQWRNGAIIALICAFVLLLLAQFHRHRDAEKTVSVPPVPQELLSNDHSLLMPTARNINCFFSDAWDACLVSSNAWQNTEGAVLENVSKRLDDALLVADEDEDAPDAKEAKKKPEKPSRAAETKADAKKANGGKKHGFRLHSADHLNDGSADSGAADEYVDHNVMRR